LLALFTPEKNLSESTMTKISFLITEESYQIRFLPLFREKWRDRWLTERLMLSFLLLT